MWPWHWDCLDLKIFTSKHLHQTSSVLVEHQIQFLYKKDCCLVNYLTTFLSADVDDRETTMKKPEEHIDEHCYEKSLDDMSVLTFPNNNNVKGKCCY